LFQRPLRNYDTPCVLASSVRCSTDCADDSYDGAGVLVAKVSLMVLMMILMTVSVIMIVMVLMM
jgi:hypothetical protein